MFCRIYQWQIEKEIDDYGQIQNQLLLKHLEKCSACQIWVQSLNQIKRELKTDQLNITDSMRQNIQEAVLSYLFANEINNRSISKNYKLHKVNKSKYAVGAAAVIVLLAVISTLFLPESDKNNYSETMESVTKFSRQLQYQTSLMTSLPEQMIESEMQNMETNIRQSIGFIQGCLPKGFVAKLSSEDI